MIEQWCRQGGTCYSPGVTLLLLNNIGSSIENRNRYAVEMIETVNIIVKLAVLFYVSVKYIRYILEGKEVVGGAIERACRVTYPGTLNQAVVVTLSSVFLCMH